MQVIRNFRTGPIMKALNVSLLLVGVWTSLAVAADPPPREIEARLPLAKGNRGEIDKVWADTPRPQRAGLEFLLLNMSEKDLRSLKAEFLLENSELAYKARAEFPWAKAVPDDIFFNNVLPYANVDESRDPWRKELYDLAKPLVKDCKTATEAVMKLNAELFPKLKVGYSTQRKLPNQSPKESIEQGKASCTGLSILLSDACRAVGVPTRVVGIPNWSNKRGNHTWLEIWDGDWHFTGACEPDPKGLDRGWFVGDAAQAQKDKPEHSIYAVSFAKTKTPFPLVWAPGQKDVSAVNVTERYTKAKPDPKLVRVMIRVTGADGKRVKETVTIDKLVGQSKDESADTNDYLTFDLPPDREYKLVVGKVELTFRTKAAGEQQLIDVKLK